MNTVSSTNVEIPEMTAEGAFSLAGARLLEKFDAALQTEYPELHRQVLTRIGAGDVMVASVIFGKRTIVSFDVQRQDGARVNVIEVTLKSMEDLH